MTKVSDEWGPVRSKNQPINYRGNWTDGGIDGWCHPSSRRGLRGLGKVLASRIVVLTDGWCHPPSRRSLRGLGKVLASPDRRFD